MPSPLARTLAALAYTGALRLPAPVWILPDWAYTLPGGLLLAGCLWAWSRGRSPFLAYHGRAGLVWTMQVSGLLLAISLLAEVSYAAWFHTGIPLLNRAWHLTADLYRWSCYLSGLLTALAMYRAAKGQTGDPLGLPL